MRYPYAGWDEKAFIVVLCKFTQTHFQSFPGDGVVSERSLRLLVDCCCGAIFRKL